MNLILQRMTPYRLVALCAFGCALVVPTAAFAGGGHGTGTIWDLKWFFLNFTLYGTALYFLLRKVVADGWQRRVTRLADEVAARAAELEVAEQNLKLAELQMQSLPGEVAQLKAQIAREAEMEAAQIVADAQRRAERLEIQTRDTIAAERRAAELGVQRDVADIVVQRAAKKIRETLTVDADRSLRARAVGGVKQLVQ